MTVHDLIRVLPAVPVLRDRCRALAALEVLVGGCGPYAYFSYGPAWGPGEEAALMDNGAGDEYALVFTAAGVFARGFDHESPMSPWADDGMTLWPGLVDTVPQAFHRLVTEPAFCEEGVLRATVVFWRESSDTTWRTGEVEVPAGVDDGADFLFGTLSAGTPEAYRDFAEDYHETTLDPAAVRHVWDLRPLTQDVVTALNPALSLDGAARALAHLGYPVGATA